ncbi:hypothetical protein GGD83_004159 [Rhodoblastus sphagnicola]|nr:hypothetical protein [Rhodoblastus sphagnicola]MBB4200330.1 hypothetical protein [Rhodoblastus sphagnicola]
MNRGATSIVTTITTTTIIIIIIITADATPTMGDGPAPVSYEIRMIHF